MIKNDPTAQISIDINIFFMEIIINYKSACVKESSKTSSTRKCPQRDTYGVDEGGKLNIFLERIVV